MKKFFKKMVTAAVVVGVVGGGVCSPTASALGLGQIVGGLGGLLGGGGGKDINSANDKMLQNFYYSTALLQAAYQNVKLATDDSIANKDLITQEQAAKSAVKNSDAGLNMKNGAEQNKKDAENIKKYLSDALASGDEEKLKQIDSFIKTANSQRLLSDVMAGVSYAQIGLITASQVSRDFSDVRGQFKVRRAVEIAAAGGHNMIMIGPPGAGKSMIAKRIPTILPPLTLEEALETTKIHSIVGLTNKRKGADSALIVQRPFRSPHHTITDTALVGGGTNPHPGEISLAHNGVLFLDELPEYKRSVLEVMRQPLEDRHITVARTKETVDYPASFMLVAAMNPCPCGHYGENNPAHPCTCTPAQVHRYMSKISGPLLDRIDIQCEIEAVPYDQLRDDQPAETSAAIRERVLRARAIQTERFKHSKLVHCNAMMNNKMVRQYCALDAESDKLLEYTMTKLGFSARAYDRILKVARTIADLEGSTNIQKNHVLEAISYRSLDRNNYAG